jgi:hypothetical protein
MTKPATFFPGLTLAAIAKTGFHKSVRANLVATLKEQTHYESTDTRPFLVSANRCFGFSSCP